MNDELVERAARALYEKHPIGCPELVPWKDLNLPIRRYYDRQARTVLEAIMPGLTLVHLCDTCAQSMCWRRRNVEDACEDPIFPGRAVIVECKAYVANVKVEEVLERAGDTGKLAGCGDVI